MNGTIGVVAAFYPLAEAAERVGGEAVSVTNLTPPGVEPHDLELTPEDLVAIAEADVVVIAGGGFQPAIEEAVEAEATGIVLDALDGVELLPAAPGEDLGDAENASDPHVWLDPTIFADITDAVAAAVISSGGDPEQVRAATEDFGRELAALDEELAGGLAECDSRLLITNHAAFGYLAARYHLEQESISAMSPESEPDPDRLADLTRRVEEAGVTTIFTEALVSPAVAETLASEAGVGTAVLDPIEGLTPEQLSAGEDYAAVMRANLRTLRDGLGCR